MHLGRLFPYHLCSQTAGGLLMAGARLLAPEKVEVLAGAGACSP